MASFEEFYFDSSTGRHSIYGLQCRPEGQVRAVVQIAHGIAEHIGRYRDFMAYLAAHGFAAVGSDHLGHGRTAAAQEDQGSFVPEQGWDHVVKDLARLHDRTAARYPGLKYVMFGHSMGSFLVRTYLAEYPEGYDMAILSGTGHQSRAAVRAGNWIAQGIVRTKGYTSDGSRLSALTMGGYLKRIKHPRTACDWLSRDEAQVDAYLADELCGFTGKAGLYADLLRGVKYVTDMDNISKMDPDKPLLLLSGDADPVGSYGKGVKRAYDCFRRVGVKDVSLKLYSAGRHEMLNEINRDQVYRDILAWLDQRV